MTRVESGMITTMTVMVRRMSMRTIRCMPPASCGTAATRRSTRQVVYLEDTRPRSRRSGPEYSPAMKSDQDHVGRQAPWVRIRAAMIQL